MLLQKRKCEHFFDGDLMRMANSLEKASALNSWPWLVFFFFFAYFFFDP